MFDYLQGFFWSLTYILLIIYALKFKRHGIPIFAVCLNYGWETIALLNSLHGGAMSAVLLIHLCWFLLDTVIFMLYLFHETPITNRLYNKMGWVAFLFLMIIIGAFVTQIGQMLIFSYIVDLLMALAFLVFACQTEMKREWLAVIIGITKCIGDMFAWLYYRYNMVVDAIGIIVLCCNILYVIILLAKPAEKGYEQNDQSIQTL